MQPLQPTTGPNPETVQRYLKTYFPSLQCKPQIHTQFCTASCTCIVLYCISLFSVVSCTCIVLYCISLFSVVSCTCIILYCISLFSVVSCTCIVSVFFLYSFLHMYCIVLYWSFWMCSQQKLVNNHRSPSPCINSSRTKQIFIKFETREFKNFHIQISANIIQHWTHEAIHECPGVPMNASS